MLKSLRTGSDPNSAVSNAMTAAKMASENRWRLHQAIPPPPLPGARPPSSRCTRPAAGARPEGSRSGVKTVASPAARSTIGQFLNTKKAAAATDAATGVTTANHTVESARYNYTNPNAAAQHHAANAISGQMPQWTHIQGVPVKAVNKNVPKMDHVSLGEIAAAEADPSNFSGVTSANHAAAALRYGLAHPNTEREANKAKFEKSSAGMPPNMKIPYKRGRTLRVAEAPPSRQAQQQANDPRVEYHTGSGRPAGLSPREAHVERFHRDIHDGCRHCPVT